MPKHIKILLTGGGTAGHVLPLLAVVNELRKIGAERHLTFEFLHIGAVPRLERKIVERMHVPYDYVWTGKLRRYLSLRNIIDIFKIPIGLLQAYWKIKTYDPDVIFGKGGYTSVPVVTAAGWQHRPILIHESDTSPGLANLRMAKYARRIALTFPESARFFVRSKVVVTGNPVREGILGGSREKGLKIFNLTDRKPIIFVTGGSLGARTLNRIVLEDLPRLLDRYQIIHQCGAAGLEAMLARLREVYGSERLVQQGEHYYLRGLGYRLRPFLHDEMADALACADLIVSRAGASTLSEIALLGKPSILIPLPRSASRGEQLTNAAVFLRAEASVIITNEEITAKKLADTVDELFSNPRSLTRMAAAAKTLAQPQAAHLIAEEIIKLAYES